MSCTEVMYQAYYPYLYQRSSGAAAPPTRAPHHHFAPFTHQYDRLRALETHQQASTSSPLGGSDSPANRWTSIVDHADSHHSSVGSGASSVGPVGGIASPASSPATANSVSVVHKEEDTSRDDVRTEMDEDDDNVQDDSRTRDRRTAAHAQYVSVNCVVFTHYTGDVASVVDEHFSRALNNDQKLSNGAHQTPSTKDTSPMSSRNFPASFWNSNYHSHHSTSQVYHPDTMYHHPGTAGNPADPWQTHYQQYTAAAAHHHHRAVHEYHHHHNMAAQYGSLLLPPPTSRLAPPPPPPPPPPSSHPHPHQYHSKASMEPWSNSAHHPALDTGASYSSYPTVPGLEAQVQETSKDLYWF